VRQLKAHGNENEAQRSDTIATTKNDTKKKDRPMKPTASKSRIAPASENGKLGCRKKNQQPTPKFAGVKRHECLQGKNQPKILAMMPKREKIPRSH